MFPFLYLLIFPWQLSSQPVMTVNFAQRSQLEAAAYITLCSEVTMHEFSPTRKGFQKETNNRKRKIWAQYLSFDPSKSKCVSFMVVDARLKFWITKRWTNVRKQSAIFSSLFCVQFHPLYLFKTLFRSLIMYIEKYILFRNLHYCQKL